MKQKTLKPHELSSSFFMLVVISHWFTVTVFLFLFSNFKKQPLAKEQYDSSLCYVHFYCLCGKASLSVNKMLKFTYSINFLNIDFPIFIQSLFGFSVQQMYVYRQVWKLNMENLIIIRFFILFHWILTFCLILTYVNITNWKTNDLKFSIEYIIVVIFQEFWENSIRWNIIEPLKGFIIALVKIS